VGSGEEDLRCRSLLTVCQRRLGLSEAEDTRVDRNARRVVENLGFDGDWRLDSLVTMGACLSSREDRVVL